MTFPRRIHLWWVGFMLAVVPGFSLISALSLAPIIIISAVLACTGKPWKPEWPATQSLAMALAVMLAFWWGMSAFNALDTTRSLQVYMKVIGVALCGWWVLRWLRYAPPAFETWPKVATMGILLALFVAQLEVLSGGFIVKHALFSLFQRTHYELEDLNRGACIIAAMLWPAVLGLMLAGKRTKALALCVVAVIVLAQLQSLTAVNAVVIASITFWALMSRLFARWRPVVAIGLPLLMALFPVLMMWLQPARYFDTEGSRFPLSAAHRLMIWDFAAHESLAHPLTGWGLDSSRDIPGGEVEFDAGLAYMPLHPHNVPLQLLLETGAIGMILAGLALHLLLRTIHRQPWADVEKNILYAQITTLCVAMLSGYGFWQFWWQAALWLLPALTFHLLPSRTTPH